MSTESEERIKKERIAARQARLKRRAANVHIPEFSSADSKKSRISGGEDANIQSIPKHPIKMHSSHRSEKVYQGTVVDKNVRNIISEDITEIDSFVVKAQGFKVEGIKSSRAENTKVPTPANKPQSQKEIDEMQIYREEMESILDECKSILCSKGKDYGNDNFIQAARIASCIAGMKLKPHVIAAALIGIKIARYGNLTNQDGEPKHESVKDTIIDLMNYVLLMDRERKRFEKSKTNNL
jgi:hypothetical protein